MFDVLSQLPLCLIQTDKSQGISPTEFVAMQGDLREAWYLSPALKDYHQKPNQEIFRPHL